MPTDSAKTVDVTRAQSAERFRRDYDRLRRLFDHAADAIFGHGPVGRFTGVNLAACETLGYTREDCLRMN